MSSGSQCPSGGAHPRLFPISPLVRFLSRLSHPLLSHLSVFLYLGRPIDMQCVQSLRVLPPQDPKQSDLPSRPGMKPGNSRLTTNDVAKLAIAHFQPVMCSY